MPGEPSHRTEVLQLSIGSVDVDWYNVMLGESLLDPHVAFYAVSFSRLPSGATNDHETLAEFERLIRASIKEMRAERSQITVDGSDGIELSMTTSEDSCARARILVADERLFQMIVEGDCAIVQSAAAGGRFLDSFHLVKD
jgi:hypothetical protein